MSTLSSQKTLGLQGCTRQAALETQDLFCTYLAHHELESVSTIITGPGNLVTTIIFQDTKNGNQYNYLHNNSLAKF